MGCGESDLIESHEESSPKKPVGRHEIGDVKPTIASASTEPTVAFPKGSAEPTTTSTKAIAKPAADTPKVAKPTNTSPKASTEPTAASPKASAEPTAASPRASAEPTTKAVAKPSDDTPKASTEPTAASPKASAEPTTKAVAKPSDDTPKASAEPTAASPKASTEPTAASPKASTEPTAASPRASAEPTNSSIAKPAAATAKAPMTVSSLSDLCDRCFGENGSPDSAKIDDIVENTTAVEDLFDTLEELQDVKGTEMLKERGERVALALELLYLLGYETTKPKLVQKPQYPVKLARFYIATSPLYCRRMAAILFLIYSDGNRVPIPPELRPTIAEQLLEIVDSFSKAIVAGSKMEKNPMMERGGNGEPPPAAAVGYQFCSIFSIMPSAVRIWNIVGYAVFNRGMASIRMLVANGFLKPAIRMMGHDDLNVASCGAAFLIRACGSELISFKDMGPEMYLSAVEKALERKEGEPTATVRTERAILGLQFLLAKRVTDDVIDKLLQWDVVLAMMKMVRRCCDTLFKDANNRSLDCISHAAAVMEMIVYNGCMHTAALGGGGVSHCWHNPSLSIAEADRVLQCFFLTALPKYEEDHDEDIENALKKAAIAICGMTLGSAIKPANIYGPILHFLKPRLSADGGDNWAWNGLGKEVVDDVIEEWVYGGKELGKLPSCLAADENWMARL